MMLFFSDGNSAFVNAKSKLHQLLSALKISAGANETELALQKLHIRHYIHFSISAKKQNKTTFPLAVRRDNENVYNS
jgi:hypothetical protein